MAIDKVRQLLYWGLRTVLLPMRVLTHIQQQSNLLHSAVVKLKQLTEFDVCSACMDDAGNGGSRQQLIKGVEGSTGNCLLQAMQVGTWHPP